MMKEDNIVGEENSSALCSAVLVSKSGTELLSPKFFLFPTSTIGLAFSFCSYFFDLSCIFTQHFQFCDPGFRLSPIYPPIPLLHSLLCLFLSPFPATLFSTLTLLSLFLSFSSLCQSSLYLPPTSLHTVSSQLPLGYCIIQM